MVLVREIIGAIFIFYGSLIILQNYTRQFNNAKNAKMKNGKHSSAAPFIGPIGIILGFLIFPVKFSPLIFLVFVIDPDTVLIVKSIPFLIKEFIRYKKENRTTH